MALTKVSNSMLVQPVNHNILINPSFTVKQRGDVVEHEVGDPLGPDRWKVRGSDAVGGTKSESSTEVDAATGINKLVVKHPRDATDPIKSNAWVYQYIEAVNIQGLYGKEMTFSFSYSDVGGSGIPKVEVWSFDSSAALKDLYDAVPTSLGDNRWTCTFNLSTNDGTIPDPSERGMYVLISANEANNAPDEWRVWETKLEVGSVVTPFIARSHGEELALCQRYYYRIWGDYAPVGTGVWKSDTSRLYNTHIVFPTTMRSVPSVSYSGKVIITDRIVGEHDVDDMDLMGFSTGSVQLNTTSVAGWDDKTILQMLTRDSGAVMFEAEL